MKVLFIALGNSAVAWFRTFLPANELGATVIGMVGDAQVGGNVNEVPNPFDFDIIVWQQPFSPSAAKQIMALQKSGVKVLFEVDDYLHGVAKVRGHRFSKAYTKERLRGYELCMRLSDGIICSTEFLARKYKKFNKNIYICKVGIDTERYNLEKPERDMLHIGWAGGTGHETVMVPMLGIVTGLLMKYEQLKFVSIGSDYADLIPLEGQTLSVPWVSIENYPGVLQNMDINLAPCHDSHYYKAKSDLRFIEPSACGIPTIAHPLLYSEIDHGETGLLVDDEKGFEYYIEYLMEDKKERERLGTNAKEWTKNNRDISIAAQSWVQAFSDVLSN